jgi:hypothetical protein
MDWAATTAEAPAAGDGGENSVPVGVGGEVGRVDGGGGEGGFDAADFASSFNESLALFITSPAAESPRAVATNATTTAKRVRRAFPSVLRFATGLDVVVATSLAPPRRRASGESWAVPTGGATLTFSVARTGDASRRHGSARTRSTRRGACSTHALRCSRAMAPKSSP